MKKRILCAILSLILLVSLIPTGALTASAASNSVSERAITVLKQLQGYKSTCSSKGYWGYGTKCTEKNTTSYAHGGVDGKKAHKISEVDADKALRAEMKTIDKAVNSFASSNGLSLSQSKHDALVLFSYRNGTAWMSGTGDVKRAVTTGVTGNEFLNMFCNWQASDADNNRRLIEANMYLNGVYSSSVASKYIKVTYNPNNGQMVANKTVYYYDNTLSETELPTPTRSGYTFKGWYNNNNAWVYDLGDMSGRNITLTADWQVGFASDAKDKDKEYDAKKVTPVNYTLSSKTLAESFVYQTPNGVKLDDGEVGVGKVSGNLKITGEYIDGKGVKWCRLGVVDKYAYTYDGKVNEYKNFDFKGSYWVKVGVSISGGGSGASGGSIDVTVTVTNSYVNSRAYESIYAPKNGSYSQGAKLRIINTADADGFLWGQVAKSAEDSTPVAWVALMYTDYSSIVNKDSSANENNSTVIAKARINLTGNSYVNLRKGAGTDNQIVGALTADTMVDIYEIKYVNGHQWGRCSQGWFLLAYADVTRLVEEDKTKETTQTGFTSYAFTGKIVDVNKIYNSPSEGSVSVDVSKLSSSQKISNGASVIVTNVTADNSGNTWGKISQGWIKMFDDMNSADNFAMSAAKFEVIADSASVREEPDTASARKDTLSKGTEFDVTMIKATDDTIWGYSDKVGDNVNKTYGGWVNLSSRYVKRNNTPSIPGVKNPSDMVATVINVDEVNVRNSASIYGGFVCKLARGTTCLILDGPENGWYRLEIAGREDQETWVYQQYLEVTSGSDSSSSSGSTSGSVETGKGIIANTYSGVNMRQTAGIGGAFMMKILTGTAVEIQEVKQVGSSKWGKLTIDGKTGWVCMDYVTMISYEDIPGYNGGNGSSGSSGGNTVTGAQTAIYTGVVVEPAVLFSTPDEFSVKGDVNEYGRSLESGNLLVFKTTDINGSVVRELSNGDPITIHEILTVEEEYTNPDEDSSGEYEGDNLGSSSDTITPKKTMYWARINDGYIRAPGANIWLDTLDEAIYTVVDHDKIYVYDDCDLKTNVTTKVENDDFTGVENLYLKKGEKATVTNVRIVGNVIAGYVENDNGEVGWVNLSKLTKGSVNVKVDNNTGSNNNGGNTNNNNNNNTPVIGDTGNTGSSGTANNTGGYKYTGKVINTDELNVRSTASTSASKTATLKSGASLVIYETTISEAMAWGRCDAGWVYLYYVDLTPAGGSAMDARVVYNDNTIIYTDSACTETAGTYARMAVIDIYEIVGKMARTDKGWVNTDNLL